MPHRPKVLLVEDDLVVAAALRRLLEVEGYVVAATHSAAEGIAAAQRGNFDVVVTDLQMPGGSGLEVIATLRPGHPHLPVILMTAHDSAQVTIEATKLGAFDYISKPIREEQFLAMLHKAVENRRLTAEPVEMGEPSHTTDALVGHSRVMQDVYKEIGRAAPTNVSILIQGETGTGKELVARALHQHSAQAHGPFVVVNCVAIPESLLESELFGHEVGAFTDAKTRRIGRFEQANRGTIFLDEIGDMSLSTQAKLLRVLQEKTIQRLGGKETISVDARVLAATHRDLKAAIAEKEFREDLFYRLEVGVIRLPPLRERLEDIPLLVDYFWQRTRHDFGPSTRGFTPEATAALAQHQWPGNVRELENVVRKALLLARGYPVTPEIVQAARIELKPPPPPSDQTIPGFIMELLTRAQLGQVENVEARVTEAIERELYSQAIRLAGGDQTKASKWLGVSRPTIREKLTRYGLHPTKGPG